VGEQWQAEAVVDESLARALIRRQCPAVEAATVELVAAGWDYTVHRVDEEWAFRFPRRAIVLEPMQTELRVLSALAAHLPVSVPAAVHLGEPSPAFPWPFYGSRWIPGREAAEARDRATLAPQLGRALRALHDADVPGLPVDVQRRADMGLRVPRTREELAAVPWGSPTVEPLLAAAAALAPPEATAVCHGDLHFRQVLVDGDRVTGIVDWVDVCRSDPGIDLALAFMFLDPAERELFFAAYGAVGDASTVRARVLALFLGAVLARYGRANANGPVEREGVASLDRAVAGL
jgi:aminoglycoside phosphotransferase (APT) family kinase protein